MRLRRINADTLIAPARGPAPKAPEGYEQDSGDPYVYHIKMPPCEYREERLRKTQCCTRIEIWCTKYNIPIKRVQCVEQLCRNVE